MEKGERKEEKEEEEEEEEEAVYLVHACASTIALGLAVAVVLYAFHRSFSAQGHAFCNPNVCSVLLFSFNFQQLGC